MCAVLQLGCPADPHLTLLRALAVAAVARVVVAMAVTKATTASEAGVVEDKITASLELRG